MAGRNVKLFIFFDGNTLEYGLPENGLLHLGRPSKENAPELPVNSPIISRRHGFFSCSKGTVTYQDTGSKNGTSVNGLLIEREMPLQLSEGSILRIHPVNSEGTVHDVVIVVSMFQSMDVQWRKISLGEEVRSLEIGRNQEIALRGKTVSRKHASFTRAQNGWAIIDNHSRNGVYLNGRRITEPVLLQPMDLVWIAHHIFVFEGEFLLYQADVEPSDQAEQGPDPDRNRQSVEFRERQAGRPAGPGGSKKQERSGGPARPSNAENAGNYQAKPEKRIPGRSGSRMLSIRIEECSVRTHLHKKILLRDIDLRIDSGSMVLILGGSGAGKTTFMNAVMGYEPAKGRILYGDSDIYRDYEKMKYEIGYVPQQDLLRMEDVVYETLDNAARMRLPENVDDAERARRVEYSLQMFGLTRERGEIVGKISGGQCKRLSIAVEYIGNPSLFFLDEPDSGLDGSLAKELMTNLRQIADQNRIVMVISHAPDRAFDLFDKVIVLAKSAADDVGHLAYYGAPAEACRFFGTETLEGIVGRINRRDEGGEGLADYYIEQFKTEQLKTKQFQETGSRAIKKIRI